MNKERGVQVPRADPVSRLSVRPWGREAGWAPPLPAPILEASADTWLHWGIC